MKVSITTHRTGQVRVIDCATDAEVTEVFESYGVERRFRTRNDANRFVGGGMTVVVTEDSPVVTQAELAAQPYEVTRARLDEVTKGFNSYLPFWKNTGASVASKNECRQLLALHAGKEGAELVRWYLNDLRAEGVVIRRTDVEPLVAYLKTL